MGILFLNTSLYCVCVSYRVEWRIDSVVWYVWPAGRVHSAPAPLLLQCCLYLNTRLHNNAISGVLTGRPRLNCNSCHSHAFFFNKWFIPWPQISAEDAKEKKIHRFYSMWDGFMPCYRGQVLTKYRVHEQNLPPADVRRELCIVYFGLLCLLIALDQNLSNTDWPAAIS